MRTRFLVRGAAFAALALGGAALALACGSSETPELLVGAPFGGEGADGSSPLAEAGSTGVSAATYDAAGIVPKKIYSAEGISAVIAPSTGELEAWGHFAYGVPLRLVVDDGGPFQPGSPTPAPITAATNWTDVSDSCGVRADGTLWCWGDLAISASVENGGTVVESRGNTDADFLANYAPGQLGGRWVSVSSESLFACGIRTDGSGWCWGDNHDDRLGIGDDAGFVQQALPYALAVPAGTQWKVIAAESFTACGIEVDGSLWCWGSNQSGALGTGSSAESIGVPTRVGDGTSWTDVTTGSDICATTGTDVYCWGEGASGVEVSARSDLPVGAKLFARSTGWTRVSTSGMGTCAIDTQGALWCADVESPGAIVMSDMTWRDVSSGDPESCALATTGLVRCWGLDDYGALGPEGGAIDYSNDSTDMTMGLAHAVDVGTF